jgi:hypothetical protein
MHGCGGKHQPLFSPKYALCRCPLRALPERMMLILVQGIQIDYMAAVFCIQMVSAILTTINADIGR